MRKMFVMVAAIVAGLTVAGLAIAGRSGAGVYTLPASGSGWTNPVQGATTISSNWANTTLADVASALTNSLDRAGTGEMDAPLKGYDGAVGAPGYTFNFEQNSGIYRIGSHDLGVSVNGVLAQEYSSAGGATTYGNSTVTGNLGVTGSTAFTGPVTAANLAATGTVGFTGKPTAAATVAGDAATTLATKGYVDAQAGLYSDGVTSNGFLPDSHWTCSYFQVIKGVGSAIVSAYVECFPAGGATCAMGTIKAGWRPTAFRTTHPIGNRNNAVEMFTINGSTGAVACTTFTAGVNYDFNITYAGVN